MSSNDCTSCSWQPSGPPGQWCMTTSQWKAVAGRVPSDGSVPVPEKLITSPTCQVNDEAGVTMAAAGGELPTEITLCAVDVALSSSVTRSRTVTLPTAV